MTNQPQNRVPHPCGFIAWVGIARKRDRLVSVFVAALAVVLAPEIGPGFSPDICELKKSRGFSPRDMFSSPEPTA